VASRAFVEAIAAQDYDDAWDLLGPRSQETLGAREALEEQGTTLTEGWGAWARSPDALIFSSGPLTDIDEDHPHGLYVVTFTGTVTQEGTTEQRTIAVPAWVEHDAGDPVRGWLEPFAEKAPPLTIVDAGRGRHRGLRQRPDRGRGPHGTRRHGGDGRRRSAVSPHRNRPR
jgi:hypothetical protein